jgi:hypothetical protein
MGRFARENRPPADYLNKSYYEIWLAGLETLLAERGLVSADDIAAAHPLSESETIDGILRHGVVETLRYPGRPTDAPRVIQRAFVSATASGEEYSSNDADSVAALCTWSRRND